MLCYNSYGDNMKKIILFAVICLLLCLTGCRNKEITKVKVAGPRVVCRTTEVLDGILTDTTITSKFDDNNLMNYQVTETVETFDDEDRYNDYVKELEILASDDSNDDIEFYYYADDEYKKVYTTLVYKESMFSYTGFVSDDLVEFYASEVVNEAEEDGYECKLYNTNRKKLGIE